MQAAVDLISQRLALELRSPIDGVISRGDLEKLVARWTLQSCSSKWSARCTRADRYRRAERQPGAGRTEGLGRQSRPSRAELPITVTRMNPVAQPREGANVFVVEATLDEVPDWLRPA